MCFLAVLLGACVREAPKPGVTATVTATTTATVTATVTVTATPPATATPLVPALSNRYILKTTIMDQVPVVFDVSANGQPVGSFEARSEQDITQWVKAGTNTLEIRHHALHPGNPHFNSTLTVGEQTPTGWNTLGKVTVNGKSLDATRVIRFTGR